MIKDLEYRSGQVFKGGRAGRWRHTTSLWDVQHLLDVQWCGLHHGPSNRHLQTMSPVRRALTASQVSVTKAGGLSDAPGAERSPNRKMEIPWHICQSSWDILYMIYTHVMVCMSMQSTQSNYNVDSSTKSSNYSKIRFKALIYFELQQSSN